MNYYAVKKGRKPGIYGTWAECETQVKGFSGAVYKKFNNLKEAESFIDGVEKNTEAKSEDIEILPGEMIAYVDGSYDINDMSYSYGGVLITSEEEIEISKRYIADELSTFRNVAGELKGAIAAIEKALDMGIKKIYLHYDYTGIENWAKGNWKTNNIATQDYKKFIDSIKDDIEIEFIKVAAHSGIYYNEKADELAKKARIS
ncbi:MAG: reverse transcriptase-like protein [Tissierellia bacterium]|nr:reverse transcriptase-like protein [Tissierellia bacterium]